jgi:hypothetical protein
MEHDWGRHRAPQAHRVTYIQCVGLPFQQTAHECVQVARRARILWRRTRAMRPLTVGTMQIAGDADANHVLNELIKRQGKLSKSHVPPHSCYICSLFRESHTRQHAHSTTHDTLTHRNSYTRKRNSRDPHQLHTVRTAFHNPQTRRRSLITHLMSRL